MVVNCLTRRGCDDRFLGRRVKSPLQEVDVGGGFLLCFVASGAGKGQDELGVLAGSIHDTGVSFQGNRCADCCGVTGETKAPEGLDFFGRKLADLLDIEVGAEGFDRRGFPSGLSGIMGCGGFGRCGFRMGLWLWGSCCGCLTAEIVNLFAVGFFQGLDIFMSLSRLEQYCISLSYSLLLDSERHSLLSLLIQLGSILVQDLLRVMVCCEEAYIVDLGPATLLVA